MSIDVALPPRGGARSMLDAVLSARLAWLTIDRNAKALTLAQTPLGIAVLTVAMVGLVATTGHLSHASLAYVGATLAALALMPARRWSILGIAGALYFVARPFRHGDKSDFAHEQLFSATLFANLEPLLAQTALAAAFLGIVFLALKAQQHWPKAATSRRPLLALLGVFAALVAIGMQLQPGGHAYALTWTMALFLSSSLFFIAYLMADQKAGKLPSGGAALGFVRPFWGGPALPFKGPAFLSRFEARTEEALAATRLKALKLMVWAVLLTYAGYMIDMTFHGLLGLPTIEGQIRLRMEGIETTRSTGYLVLGVGFMQTILWMGAFSHTLVAIIRMAGFAIPRNMARPLTSRSLAEFWNRYVYYFKEVLVDFFFYPAFARYFKGNIALRTAFATFCAACIGNVLFSLVAQANLFAEVGLLGVARHFESYAFYAFMLALFLIASQLRKSKPKPQDGWLRYDVLPRAWVIFVFAFLLIFADESGTFRLADRLDFAGWLLFVR